MSQLLSSAAVLSFQSSAVPYLLKTVHDLLKTYYKHFTSKVSIKSHLLFFTRCTISRSNYRNESDDSRNSHKPVDWTQWLMRSSKDRTSSNLAAVLPDAGAIWTGENVRYVNRADGALSTDAPGVVFWRTKYALTTCRYMVGRRPCSVKAHRSANPNSETRHIHICKTHIT